MTHRPQNTERENGLRIAERLRSGALPLHHSLNLKPGFMAAVFKDMLVGYSGVPNVTDAKFAVTFRRAERNWGRARKGWPGMNHSLHILRCVYAETMCEAKAVKAKDRQTAYDAGGRCAHWRGREHCWACFGMRTGSNMRPDNRQAGGCGTQGYAGGEVSGWSSARLSEISARWPDPPRKWRRCLLSSYKVVLVSNIHSYMNTRWCDQPSGASRCHPIVRQRGM